MYSGQVPTIDVTINTADTASAAIAIGPVTTSKRKSASNPTDSNNLITWSAVPKLFFMVFAFDVLVDVEDQEPLGSKMLM